MDLWVIKTMFLEVKLLLQETVLLALLFISLIIFTHPLMMLEFIH